MENATLIIIGLGITLGFLVQTIVGFAATLFALPILLTALSLQDSISLLSIFHLIFSLVLISKNYRSIDRQIALEMVIGGVVGLVIGVHVLKNGSPEILKKLLGIFIVSYAIQAFFKKKRVEFFQRMGIIFTLLGGFFSGLFSAGGPLFGVYVYNRLKKPTEIRATLIGTLMVVSIFRIPLLVVNGLIAYDTLLQSIFVLPFFIASIYFGGKLHKNIDEATFKKIFLGLLFISGVSLIVE